MADSAEFTKIAHFGESVENAVTATFSDFTLFAEIAETSENANMYKIDEVA